MNNRSKKLLEIEISFEEVLKECKAYQEKAD